MSEEKQKDLEITFDINIIDHLGVKLYSTVPPMIAELISNAWDSDAHNVYIDFSTEDTKSISVRDDGNGMDFDELNNCFLKIGRNRRVENNSDKTKSSRPVLGKKGLGKLSMFGIGKVITVSTTKDGIRNTFTMNYDDIKNSHSDKYKPEIIEKNTVVDGSNGTLIKIEKLAKSAGFDLQELRSEIISRFRIFSPDFIVHINDDKNLEINKNEFSKEMYQFSWKFPENFLELKDSSEDLYNFGINNRINGEIYTSKTPLKKNQQGIILFSRGKLVQENMSFSKRGNDNFFQYMTGSFNVDFVDSSYEIDNCSTDRKSLAWDSYNNSDLKLLDELMQKIVSLTQSKWRVERKKDKKKRIVDGGINPDDWINDLNPAEQPLAKKLVDAIIDNENIEEDSAREYLSCIKDMYDFTGFKDFTAKLDNLNELGNENALKLLTDWAEIEAKEFAKISLGRIKTIEQFEKFVRDNESETKVIQRFLEEFPWLLDARMSKFEREVTYSKILKETFSDSELPESDRRIDFLCTNDSGIIHIIELKRPNVKLTFKQLQQIAAYVEFIKRQYPEQAKEVYGYLISDNMSYEDGAETMRDGLKTQNIFIKSYSDLLAEARTYNKKRHPQNGCLLL